MHGPDSEGDLMLAGRTERQRGEFQVLSLSIERKMKCEWMDVASRGGKIVRHGSYIGVN